MGSDREFPVDGSTVVFGLREDDSRYLETVGDERVGLLSIEFIADTAELTDPSLPPRGRLRIRSTTGAIQPTDAYSPYNAAPIDGYQPYVDLVLEGDETKVDSSFFFHGDDRQIYGSVRVWMSYSYDYGEKMYRLPLEVRLGRLRELCR